MKLIDWVAILGALAWTPHLISMIRNWLSKPEIRVITPRSVSLGFTTLGSIFNLHLAFAVKNKDIVISSIKLKLKHETGGEKNFEWQGIQQQVMKMKIPDGSVLPYEKEQSVLAMKLNQKDIVERFIQFQEKFFIEEKYARENKALKNIAYLKSQEKYDPMEFMSSQDMQELVKYIQQSFYWQVGTYEVTIQVESPEPFVIKGNKYLFSLTPLDIEALENNKDFIENDYKNILVPQSDEEFKKVEWKWRNPPLQKT
ncbi:MAG: hypothetical protein AB2597_01980 [Candidatus Thiodiazotropha sp.]